MKYFKVLTDLRKFIQRVDSEKHIISNNATDYSHYL